MAVHAAQSARACRWPRCAAAVMLFISEGSYWRSVGTLDALGDDGDRAHQPAGPGAQHARRRDRAARLPADRPQANTCSPTSEALNEIDDVVRASGTLLRRRTRRAGAVLTKLRKRGRRRKPVRARADHRPARARARRTRRATIVLTDIGKEQMDAIRALSAELLARETRSVAARPQRHLPHAAAQPHRHRGAERRQPAGAVHVPAPERWRCTSSSSEQQRLLQAERDRLEVEVAQRTAAADRADAPPADRARRRARPPGARPARRAGRAAHLGQARRGAHQLAPGRRRAGGAGAPGAPGRTRSTAASR